METNSKKRKLSQHSNGKNDGSIEAENARMKQTIEKLNAAIVNQVLEIAELKSNQSNGVNEADEDMKAEMETMKENEAKLRAELIKTEKKMEEEHKHHEVEVAALKSAAEIRDKEMNELKEQLLIIKDVKVELGSTDDKLEEERAAFQVQINEIKEHTAELTKKNAALEAEAQEAQQKADARKKELKEQLASAKRDAVELRTKNNVLENDKRKYEAKINGMSSQINCFTKETATSKAEAEKAREIVDGKDKEIEELGKQFSSANASKNELTKEIAAVGVQLENTWKRLRAKIEAKINELKLHIHRLNKTKFELELDAENLQKTIAENEKKIQYLKDEQQKTETKYKKKIKELEDQLRKIKYGKDLRGNEIRHKEGDEASTSENVGLQRNVNEEYSWMNECRTACIEVFDESTKKLLRENGEQSIDEIFRKFEENKYKSPVEFFDSLTALIQTCLNNYEKRSTKHQELTIMNQTLDNAYKPIIEKFTQMKNGQTTNAR